MREDIHSTNDIDKSYANARPKLGTRSEHVTLFSLYHSILCSFHRKYDFKGKKRKISEEDDEQSLADSVRTISALFQVGGNAILPNSRNGLQPDASLEVRVASIGAEIAAAIAQAQSRVYEVDEEEDEEDEESGSGQELGGPEIIGPNTSGIRDLGNEAAPGVDKEGRIFVEEDDDSDAFPMPLRTRKGKDSPTIGNKRKR